MIYKSYSIENNINKLDKKFALFYGENLGLKNDFKKRLKNLKKNPEIINFSQEEIIKNASMLYNEASNVSLFEKEKIIFIEGANDKIFNILDEIIKKKLDQIIILFAENLEKKSKLRGLFEQSKLCAAIPCYEDNEITLRRIVSERLKDYKGLSGENINLIINNCNLDRMKLNNELEKIETYFQDRVLKNEQLSILLNAKTSENFNLLKDEAFKGNKKKTNELLSETIIEQEKNIYYLNLINNRLNKLNEIQNKENISNLINIIDNIKPPIFWKDKPNLVEQAKKWDKKKVNIMLNKTYETERLMKSNASIDKNVLLKKVILDLCTLANS